MNNLTVVGLVENVHQAAVNIGMDVSPKDVAYIISLFLEGFIATPPTIPVFDEAMQKVIEELHRVSDES